MEVGFAINISDAPRGAKCESSTAVALCLMCDGADFGTFLCVGGSYSAFPVLVAWLGNNGAASCGRHLHVLT